MKKVVTNAGDHDGTTVYFHDGHKIIETRNGSSKVVQQFVRGVRYIDEIVMVRLVDEDDTLNAKGDLYVHQDANWNVIALTDLGGSVVERYVYNPYGQFVVQQETSWGDRDGDGDVDATDKGTPGSTCTGTVTGACRILDLDFDGDYDAADATDFANLPQGLARHPGRKYTGVEQVFAHQGLLYEPEIGSYHNRARQYHPTMRRFVQRDPLALQPGAGKGYQDGMNLFQYIRGNALRWSDPSGSKPGPFWPTCCDFLFDACMNDATGLPEQIVCTCLSHRARCKAGVEDRPCHIGKWLNKYCSMIPGARGCGDKVKYLPWHDPNDGNDLEESLWIFKWCKPGASGALNWCTTPDCGGSCSAYCNSPQVPSEMQQECQDQCDTACQ